MARRRKKKEDSAGKAYHESIFVPVLVEHGCWQTAEKKRIPLRFMPKMEGPLRGKEVVA